MVIDNINTAGHTRLGILDGAATMHCSAHRVQAAVAHTQKVQERNACWKRCRTVGRNIQATTAQVVPIACREVEQLQLYSRNKAAGCRLACGREEPAACHFSAAELPSAEIRDKSSCMSAIQARRASRSRQQVRTPVRHGAVLAAGVAAAAVGVLRGGGADPGAAQLHVVAGVLSADLTTQKPQKSEGCSEVREPLVGAIWTAADGRRSFSCAGFRRWLMRQMQKQMSRRPRELAATGTHCAGR